MATDTNTTRRTLMANIAALPLVAAVPAIAEIDPIFAALEQRKATISAVNNYPEDDDVSDVLFEAMLQSERNLAETIPVSIAGALTSVEFLKSYVCEIYGMENSDFHDSVVILGILNSLIQCLRTQQTSGSFL